MPCLALGDPMVDIDMGVWSYMDTTLYLRGWLVDINMMSCLALGDPMVDIDMGFGHTWTQFFKFRRWLVDIDVAARWWIWRHENERRGLMAPCFELFLVSIY